MSELPYETKYDEQTDPMLKRTQIDSVLDAVDEQSVHTARLVETVEQVVPTALPV